MENQEILDGLIEENSLPSEPKQVHEITKNKKIVPSVKQLIHSKLAMFITDTRGCDLYYIMEVVQILRSIVGEQPLKEYYGTKYKRLIKQLNKLNYKLNLVKHYYDSIKILMKKRKRKD